MTSLDDLAGGARGGTLYGIGVGPGDVRYLTLRAAGFPPTLEAREYTMAGLVLAITEHVHRVAAQQLLQRLGLNK